MTDCTERSLPPLRVVGVSTVAASMDEIGEAVGPLFGRLFGAFGASGERPSGPPVAWYDARVDGSVAVHAGLPYDGHVPGLDGHELPGADRAVCTLHHGSMETVGQSWQALMEHVGASGLVPAGSAREIYLEAPPDDADAWVTELQIPVTAQS